MYYFISFIIRMLSKENNRTCLEEEESKMPKELYETKIKFFDWEFQVFFLLEISVNKMIWLKKNFLSSVYWKFILYIILKWNYEYLTETNLHAMIQAKIWGSNERASKQFFFRIMDYLQTFNLSKFWPINESEATYYWTLTILFLSSPELNNQNHLMKNKINQYIIKTKKKTWKKRWLIDL